MTEVPIKQKPVHLFALQITGLVSIWYGPPKWKSKYKHRQNPLKYYAECFLKCMILFIWFLKLCFGLYRVRSAKWNGLKCLMKKLGKCLNGILNSIWSRIQIKCFCFQKSFHIFFVAYFSQVLSDTFWEASKNN